MDNCCPPELQLRVSQRSSGAKRHSAKHVLVPPAEERARGGDARCAQFDLPSGHSSRIEICPQNKSEAARRRV
eukprot:4182818-Pyramimonas_sp.AAC.1